MLLEGPPNTWQSITNKKQDELLIKAATEIISQAADSQLSRYSLVSFDNDKNSENGEFSCAGENTESSQKKIPIDSDTFHSRLRIFTTISLDDVEKYLSRRVTMLREPFGVLLLLYTVVCTKGIPGMRSEMSDPTEPAIDSTYGYGSQSLINLMLTGRAVSHVWDHDQDVGGLSKIIKKKKFLQTLINLFPLIALFCFVFFSRITRD